MHLFLPYLLNDSQTVRSTIHFSKPLLWVTLICGDWSDWLISFKAEHSVVYSVTGETAAPKAAPSGNKWAGNMLMFHDDVKMKRLKGAVCRILTLLKHKNTIICLQKFKKHAKLTNLFIWKTILQSLILLRKCAFRPGLSVFVMVCETRPLPVYPIVFRHRGLPVGENTAYLISFIVMCASFCWCR